MKGLRGRWRKRGGIGEVGEGGELESDGLDQGGGGEEDGGEGAEVGEVFGG